MAAAGEGNMLEKIQTPGLDSWNSIILHRKKNHERGYTPYISDVLVQTLCILEDAGTESAMNLAAIGHCRMAQGLEALQYSFDLEPTHQ